MLVRKSKSAIKLITDRISTATLFQFSKQLNQLSTIAVSSLFLHCLSAGVTGQVNLNPPTEILAPPRVQQASSVENQDSILLLQDQQESPDNQELQDDDPRQALMSGPMHEAFLEVHEADPKPNAVVKKEPPEPINEIPPEYKPDGQNVLWIPGYWGWDFEKEDFVWVSGLWRDIPPDRKWIPGYWQKVDEGFRWISGYWQLESDEDIDYLPQPPENIDSGPSTPSPGDDYFYVPGTWIMNNSTYHWSPGYWQANLPDWVWVPTRYIWTPYGCIYRPGYWDRVIDRRGVCFAPVYYSTPYYRNIGYRYTPRYSINVGVRLLPHLFVNLRYGHFYYGDWYASSFRRHGICPWVNVHRYHRRYYDPLLSYYSNPTCRYNNRNSFSWARDHHLHVTRNPHLRPCRNFGGPAIRRDGVSGSIHVRNGSVNIGVRYTDLVRNSRRSGNAKPGKGPHYHREFRQLSKADLNRENNRIKPIHDVRVARRTHEVQSRRPNNVTGPSKSQGRARDGKRGKKLNLEKYIASTRNSAADNRGKNNATRLAGTKGTAPGNSRPGRINSDAKGRPGKANPKERSIARKGTGPKPPTSPRLGNNNSNANPKPTSGVNRGIRNPLVKNSSPRKLDTTKPATNPRPSLNATKSNNPRVTSRPTSPKQVAGQPLETLPEDLKSPSRVPENRIRQKLETNQAEIQTNQFVLSSATKPSPLVQLRADRQSRQRVQFPLVHQGQRKGSGDQTMARSRANPKAQRNRQIRLSGIRHLPIRRTGILRTEFLPLANRRSGIQPIEIRLRLALPFPVPSQIFQQPIRVVRLVDNRSNRPEKWRSKDPRKSRRIGRDNDNWRSKNKKRIRLELSRLRLRDDVKLKQTPSVVRKPDVLPPPKPFRMHKEEPKMPDVRPHFAVQKRQVPNRLFVNQ